MSNIYPFSGGPTGGLPPGGGSIPPVETRVANLEQLMGDIRVDLASVKQKLDSELPHLATKADLQALQNSLIKWAIATLLGGIAAAAAIVFGIAKLNPPLPPQINITLPSNAADQPKPPPVKSKQQ